MTNKTYFDAINEYISTKTENISKSIKIKEDISLEKHKKIILESNEIPLLGILKTSPMGVGSTYLLITNTHIHFALQKDSFFTGIIAFLMKKNEGKIPLSQCNRIEIGEHDKCFGTAYFGHQLKVNNEVLGLIRMGSGLTLDENAISYLNNLFDFMFEKGLLKEKVGSYLFQ